MRKALLVSAVCVFVLFCLGSSVSAKDRPKDVQSLLNDNKYVPDVATFLQIGSNTPAGNSWDGEHVYFYSNMSGSNQVYRITGDGWPYQLTTFEDGVDFFELSWDHNMAVVGASIGGSEQSQLYLLDTMTGRVVRLTNKPRFQHGSVIWARDDESFFFRSNEENGRDFFIYEMEISTGQYRKVFDAAPGYNLCANISLDGSQLILYNFSSNINNDLYLLEVREGKSQRITEDTTDVTYLAPTLMPDNRTIWVVCNLNSDRMGRVATMTVGSPKVNFVDDQWVEKKWEVEGIGFSRDFKLMGMVYNEDGYARVKVREVRTGKELPNPPLDGIIGFGGVDVQGNVFLSFQGPTRAPDVWKWNPGTRKLKQLTFSIYAGIDRDLFRAPQLVRYESFDEEEVPAFLYLPPDYRRGPPIPFIVHAHGGPESQFRPNFARNFQYFLLNGYGILAPNPRGSSGYGLRFQNLDNYKKRKDSLKDYKAGVEWLIENGYTKKGLIGIRGGSYGGYVVLGMITEYPDLFSAAVDVVGIANFKTFLENTADYRRALRESEYGPLSDPEFLDEISPIHKVHLIETPLFVVHGANDPRVPVGEARQIIQAIEEKGGEVESLIFSDEGHGTGKRVNTIIEYRKQVEFFNRYLRNRGG